ncbi:hypothetical protein EDC04DRAFT_2615049 [Pisolithus marmoratus]|nr:hypothetical protein EDC04DRAFT_2615049 [Pisolithus marmoratus]
MAQLPPSLDLPQPMSGTLPIPSHPWALEGEYNFSGLSATMECGNVLQPNANVSDASSSMSVMLPFHTPGMVTPLCPVVPPSLVGQLNPDNTIHDFLDANSNNSWDSCFQSSMNWAPPFILPGASECGCVASDSQPLSGAPPILSSLQPASGNIGPSSGSNGSGSSTMGSVTVRDSFVSYLPGTDQALKENVKDTNHSEVLITEGIRDVSTWATCNPDAHIIQPCPPRQILEAQKESWAITHEQRVTKKTLLDKAMQEYLAQQALRMEEITLRHNVMVEYLKGIVGSETHYHSSQKVQWHNALLHAKALEVNADHPSGSKYSLKEIQQMVKEDKKLQNLTQEEMDHYISALNEHHDMKIHGMQANNVVAAQDVLMTTDKITKEFWEDIFGHQIADVACQYEQWACTQNQNLLKCDSLGNLHKQITKAVSSGLKRIMNKKHIVMNYHNYETAIVETYGVCLVGWPEGVKFTNLGCCFWKKLSKNELEHFITKLNTCCVAGETVQKPRKKQSDAGMSQKCKAPTCGKENVPVWKKAHSSHKHVLPKSMEIIATSNEEDSEDV